MKHTSVRMRGLTLLLALVLSFGLMGSALAQATSINPLVAPQPVTSYIETEDELINVLLLGIDLGFEGYWGSAGKDQLMECHTDGFMVVSFNKTKQRVDFVSIPRDTLTYVPGVHGIYKLNAAFNCAATPDEGIQHCIDAASRMLGGIKIDRYCMVDMGAMIALGHLIGGVDFDLDMSYRGMNGVWYTKGEQHLDGNGIMEYVRARKNASVEDNDLGRTRRQRAMMIALFQKLRSNTDLIAPIFDLFQSGEKNVFTNLTLEDVTSLLPFITAIEDGKIGNHVMTGRYRFALVDWNFTFTDQEHRLGVLKEVYGLNAEEIPFVTYEYTKWLMDKGMNAARALLLTGQVLEYGQGIANPTQAQQDMLVRLTAAYDAAVAAFDKASSTMEYHDTNAMSNARKEMREVAEQAAQVFGYTANIPWFTNEVWYRDRLVNECDIDWR